jgi:hypothetical protein
MTKSRGPEGPQHKTLGLLAWPWEASEHRLLLWRVAQQVLQVLPAEHGRALLYVLAAATGARSIGDEVLGGLTANRIADLVLTPNRTAVLLGASENHRRVAHNV